MNTKQVGLIIEVINFQRSPQLGVERNIFICSLNLFLLLIFLNKVSFKFLIYPKNVK